MLDHCRSIPPRFPRDCLLELNTGLSLIIFWTQTIETEMYVGNSQCLTWTFGLRYRGTATGMPNFGYQLLVNKVSEKVRIFYSDCVLLRYCSTYHHNLIGELSMQKVRQDTGRLYVHFILQMTHLCSGAGPNLAPLPSNTNEFRSHSSRMWTSQQCVPCLLAQKGVLLSSVTVSKIPSRNFSRHFTQGHIFLPCGLLPRNLPSPRKSSTQATVWPSTCCTSLASVKSPISGKIELVSVGIFVIPLAQFPNAHEAVGRYRYCGGSVSTK